MDWTQIGTWVLGIVAALAAAGFALKFVFNRKSTSTRNVIKGNSAGGDIIVGNKTTGSHNKR